MPVAFEEAKRLRETNPFDSRNVRDEFKGLPNEEIQAELRKTKSDMVLCLSNEIRDMNLSSCIRSANSFNIYHVVMCGRRNYDRRGAVGAQNYIEVKYEENLLLTVLDYSLKGYHIVALEHDDRYPMTSLTEYSWQPKTLMICGEEGRSISDEILALSQVSPSMLDIVYIPMMGTVRSLNLASAASIAMYDYHTKLSTNLR